MTSLRHHGGDRPEVPLVLAYAAKACIDSLRQRTARDLALEVTFTPDTLRMVAAEEPLILQVRRLYGVPLTFPERPTRYGMDWEVEASDGRDWVAQAGTVEVLLRCVQITLWGEGIE